MHKPSQERPSHGSLCLTQGPFSAFDGKNIFLSLSLFADYERRGSASQDHEESRIILAQKIEKETVGSRTVQGR